MWRELVAELTDDHDFADPVGIREVEEAERALGHPLPEVLVSLLRETNGIKGAYGLGLVWSLKEIVEENLHFRSGFFDWMYMPFHPLLFFADAGNGDRFALRLPPVTRENVFCWDHEDDSRTWAAPDVATYLRWWLTGRLKV
ncbi:SMI1/KNR4 family protein [Nonomuraea dietziae]|uniref:Knr4/Smi1-like domain-containing protein n=1 Tax=Nonomuraea dietziae TaxID=65515 RepID=A0A7W5YUM9_9ACTN|nr:SMI1/KNR4 family protein [Nonomuraea dietziae]MBB3733734.1 hypothetical protein [Nonomuraea dietziae]